MPSDETSEQVELPPASEARSVSDMDSGQYNSFWPSSPGKWVVALILFIIGVSILTIGSIDDDMRFLTPAYTALYLYAVSGVVCFLLFLVICRFVYQRVVTSETAQNMRTARRERAELASLRRQVEIKRLKRELEADGEDSGE
jgi:hypothetical protein